LWVAKAPTFDFRQARWVEQPAQVEGGKVVGLVAPPEEGCLAFYAELDYDFDGLPHQLSTQLRVIGKPTVKGR
jgi:hypothetical protein